MFRRIRTINAVWLFTGLFAGLAIQFVFATPTFEAPDESEHFSVINSIIERGKLPNHNSARADEWGWRQEGSQPPLFYTIGSLVAAPFDRSDLPALRTRNPHAQIGYTFALGNVNQMAVHEPYTQPPTGTRAAVTAVRLLNVVFGAATVLAVWVAASTAFPADRRIAVLAAGLVALNPQFAFVAGAVNNDILAALLSSLIVWRMLVMLRDGFNRWNSLVIAVLVALASLTKLSGLAFGLIVGAAALWTTYRRRDWRGLLVLAGLGVLIWLVGAGWWYARNLELYGEPLGTQHMIRIMGRRDPQSVGAILRELISLTSSYWAVFGWFNILVPLPVYTLIDILMIAAGIGMTFGMWRDRQRPDRVAPIAVQILTVTIGLVALVSWTQQTYGTQGRLLFPYIAAISGLLAYGLTVVHIPPRVLLPILAVGAYLVPSQVIVPRYTPPPPIDSLPASATPFDVAWDGQVELLGYEYMPDTYSPGDVAWVTLYWRPIERSATDYSIFAHMVIPTPWIVGQADTYPSGGLRRTSQWAPGLIYPDRIPIRFTEAVSDPQPLRFVFGWYDITTGDRLTAVDRFGNGLRDVSFEAGLYVPAPTN